MGTMYIADDGKQRTRFALIYVFAVSDGGAANEISIHTVHRHMRLAIAMVYVAHCVCDAR